MHGILFVLKKSVKKFK
uniref:Uncharacterized protein n=1 Tax=Arundo donax TaxID=35708 RepID=A0A0A9BFZ9_ARUDO